MIWWVIGIRYSWINHDNLSLLVIMKVMIDILHLGKRESLWIKRKDL